MVDRWVATAIMVHVVQSALSLDVAMALAEILYCFGSLKVKKNTISSLGASIVASV